MMRWPLGGSGLDANTALLQRGRGVTPLRTFIPDGVLGVSCGPAALGLCLSLPGATRQVLLPHWPPSPGNL